MEQEAASLRKQQEEEARKRREAEEEAAKRAAAEADKGIHRLNRKNILAQFRAPAVMRQPIAA